MPKHPKTVTIDGFKGLNNVLPPERTPPEYLKEVSNIDIDKSGGLHKRKGYTLIDSGVYHSLWSDGDVCYAVKDSEIVDINKNYNITTIQAVTSDKISFDKVNSSVYFSGTEENGVIENGSVRPWGLQWMNPQPAISTGNGVLTAGTYQVTCTYVTVDGRESGTGLAQKVTISDNQGIVLSNIPTSPDSNVDRIRVYASTPNGEVLYLADEIPNGTSTHYLGDVWGAVQPLLSFNMYPAPRGHIVKYAHGRTWIAADNILWYSSAFSFEWFNIHEDYMYFPERIRAVMPTQDGMWIAADKLYYLAGKNPDKAVLSEKEPVKAVEGSDVKIVGAYVFIENTPIGYKWLITTDKGIYVCYNDGITLNMTEKNVTFPPADEGTATFVQEGGINRYVSILKKKGDNNNMAVGDQATATIIRNGIVLEE